MKQILFIFIFTLCGIQLFAQFSNDTIELRKGKFIQGYKFLSNRDMKDILKVNPEALKELKQANTYRVFDHIFSAAGGFLIGAPIGTAIGGGEPHWEVLAIGVGIVLATIPLTVATKNHRKKAIKLYNDEIRQEKPGKISVNFQVTGGGVGIVLNY